MLEMLLIDRINRHIHSNNMLNKKQYGFLPQKSTFHAALAKIICTGSLTTKELSDNDQPGF